MWRCLGGLSNSIEVWFGSGQVGRRCVRQVSIGVYSADTVTDILLIWDILCS